MDKYTLTLSHWCSLKDGVQSGNCQLLAAEPHLPVNIAEVLTGKKLRNVDPQTLNMLCCFAALSQTTYYEPHAAMVSATSMGAFDSVCKLLVESRQNALPYQISPGNISNTVINSTAGIAAIHYGFDGPNISLCANELSFYEALTKAFALGTSGQANDVFVSALESWEGLYGRTLNPLRQSAFPQQCYAALFMFSQPEQESDRILAVTSGRFHQPEQIADTLARFLSEQGVTDSDLEHISLWDTENQFPAIREMYPHSSLSILPASASVLMSGLGAWQFEHLLSVTSAGNKSVQLAMDAEGFYGIALIQKAAG